MMPLNVTMMIARVSFLLSISSFRFAFMLSVRFVDEEEVPGLIEAIFFSFSTSSLCSFLTIVTSTPRVQHQK